MVGRLGLAAILALAGRQMTKMEDHTRCYDREYDLLEEIKWLKGQITYLQEELASAENLIMELQDQLATYDEGFM